MLIILIVITLNFYIAIIKQDYNLHFLFIIFTCIIWIFNFIKITYTAPQNHHLWP
jgi:hypothetical protein